MSHSKGGIAPKEPPKDEAAEAAVLGACLRYPGTALPLALEKLVGGDFCKPGHRCLFEKLGRMFIDGTGIDLVTVTDYLEKERQLEAVGGRLYLISLIENCHTDANLTYHCKIVKEKSNLRRLGKIGLHLYNRAYADNGTTPEELVSLAGEAMFAVTRGDASSPHRTGRLDFDSLLDKRGDATGLPWGISWLDNHTGGLQPQDLILLAGREKLGKTALAMHILRFNAKLNIPVLNFSLEMSSAAVAQRIIAAECRIPSLLLQTGRTTNEHNFAIDRFKKSHTFAILKENYLVDDRPQSRKTLPGALRLHMQQYKIGLVMLDYMKLFAGDDVKEVNECYQLLKALAKEYNVPVIVLSALHRPGMGLDDKPPEATDLRIGGEYDCDYLLLGYNPAVRLLGSPTSTLNAKEFGLRNEWENRIRWYLKYDRRGGAAGATDLFFDRSCGYFGELETVEREQF